MRRFKTLSTLFAVIGLSACTAPAIVDSQSGQKVTEATVRNPGHVLVTPGKRPAELALAANREKLCGYPPELTRRPSVRPEALRAIPVGGGYGGGSEATVAEPFILEVMSLSAAIWGNQDKNSTKHFTDMLLLWENNKNLTSLEGDIYNSTYFTSRAALPLISSYSLLRPEIDQPQRIIIEQWLKDIVSNLDIEPGYAGENNHRYLRDSVHMAYGALKGDSREFQIGINGYANALKQARPDGGFPHELRRGFRAIFYQRHAIASLVTMAEIAALQGYDLYGLKVGEVDLHKSITFMLRAIDTPEIVFSDAAYNLAIPKTASYRNQDVSFLGRRGHGRHYMAWILPYMSRFPNHENSVKLRALVLDGTQPHPMIDELSGGNMSCLFAALPTP